MTTLSKVYAGAEIRASLDFLRQVGIPATVANAVAHIDQLRYEADIVFCPVCDGAGHGADRH